MVEAASTFFMSSFAEPTTAPNTSVIAPITATASWASGERSKIGPDRTTRYTPAVTMVAAWMSAETGVGPAIASPSQACSGNCADLPVAPSRRSNPMAVAQPGLRSAPRTSPKVTDPTCATMAPIARRRPASPTRFITNAFLAAVAYTGLWFQNPISR